MALVKKISYFFLIFLLICGLCFSIVKNIKDNAQLLSLAKKETSQKFQYRTILFHEFIADVLSETNSLGMYSHRPNDSLAALQLMDSARILADLRSYSILNLHEPSTAPNVMRIRQASNFFSYVAATILHQNEIFLIHGKPTGFSKKEVERFIFSVNHLVIPYQTEISNAQISSVIKKIIHFIPKNLEKNTPVLQIWS